MKQKGEHLFAFFVGWKKGFEPSTLGTTIRYSNQLSYIHHFETAKIRFFLIGKYFYSFFSKIFCPCCKRLIFSSLFLCCCFLCCFCSLFFSNFFFSTCRFLAFLGFFRFGSLCFRLLFFLFLFYCFLFLF